MIRIHYRYDATSVVFTAEDTAPGGLRGPFGSTATVENVDAWVAGDTARCAALAALRMYGEDHPGMVRIEDGRISASHGAVAALRTGQARAFGLPDPPPHVLAVDTRGVIGSSSFELTARWLDAATRRSGAFLETARGTFLIPEPLFSAIELADRFNAGAVELPDHWAALARFRRLLDPDAGNENDLIEMSRFLEDLRIYTGAALSLALANDADGLDFDPVLFDAEAVQDAEDQGRPLTENDGMSQDLLRRFQRHPNMGFRAFSAAKRSYLLGGNTYLIVEDDLEVALQVVREKQQAEPEERRAFAANPRAAIAERLAENMQADGPAGDPEASDALEEEVETRATALFVETPEYADRAFGIGLWKRPNLDFLPPPWEPNVWLPETFALELGGVWVRLDQDAVTTLRTKVDKAIAAGQASVEHQGQQIPATDEVRRKLAETIGTERPVEPAPENGGEGREPADRTVALVRENYVEENWRPERPPREASIPPEEPLRVVRTPLLRHQRDALKWQIAAWQAGYPGVLNADDQGLGKTLQTLAFLVWLQRDMANGPVEKRKAILIVAPTGLLRTWEAEVEKHLTGTRLGARIRTYGGELRSLRKPGVAGRDTDDGRPRLDFRDVRSASENGNGHRCWLLTTYETLASYQHSFRQLDFSVVVFDEIQKIKNVRTLAALAARAVKADFRIGLTGTPIENHIADLWAIMDAVAPGRTGAPGRLGALKDFIKRYRVVTEAGMRELHARLFRAVKADGRCYPPIAQRRLKDNEIADLPRKDYRVYPTTMPEIQADAYEAARRHLADGARGAALKLLHHIRGVSLHPERPDACRGDIDAWFALSARFEAARRILARIHARGERALIYTEDRRMQGFVAQWLRSELGLDNVSIINGATPIARRHRHVERFQQHVEADGGFDVMILSPRAAGVGLTLTAATHVIHLSRWWNPAVEEQCNDRIYRIGQTHDVTVHVPLAIHPAYRERSFDCVLNDLMRRKTSLARAALWPPTENDFDIGMLMAGLSGSEPIDPAEIDGLDWARFEEWVLDRARDSGDWEVSETPRSGDGGADAVLRHRRRRNTAVLAQVKHTTDRERSIDPAAIREIMHAAERYDVCNPQLVVITNAHGFTPGARNLALENGVVLLDRNRLGLWPSHVLGG